VVKILKFLVGYPSRGFGGDGDGRGIALGGGLEWRKGMEHDERVPGKELSVST
jgi:hypothetical protein